jgi:PAS domain S-box-containing protein/putative nucleotidyltransferase with HDIG domain
MKEKDKTHEQFIKELTQLRHRIAEFESSASQQKQIEETLRMERDKAQHYLDVAQVMLLILNKKGEITLINRKGNQILGYKEGELIGKNWFENCLPPRDRKYVKGMFRKLMAGEAKMPEFNENPVLTKSGTERMIAWHNTQLKDAAGNSIGILSSGQDITERKGLAEIVEKDRQDLKLIIDSSPIIIFYKDTEGKFIRVNKTFAEALKMPEDDFVGKTVFDLYSPQIAQGMADDDQEVFQSGRPKLHIIERYESAEGIRWVQTDKIPIYDKHGIPSGLIGFAQDITERKQAEELLLHERETFSTILENALYGVVLMDKDGRHLYVNPTFTAITGYTLEDIPTGRDWMHKAYPDKKYRQKVREFWQNDGEIAGTTREVSVVCKDGKTKEIEFRRTQLADGRAVVMLVNITERKQAEEERHRNYQQMREMLLTTVNALASTIGVKDQFTAAHQPRATQLASAIAEEMGLQEEQIEGIRMAASIHDIGKLTVPAEFLNKPGPLTDFEYQIVKMHPRTSYEILKEIKFPWPVAQIVLQHHELMDGSGYPQGLSGEQILLEARILTVANVVEAMTSHRPYRAAHSIETALEEISRNKGKLYDPVAVDACLKLFAEKHFTFN